MRSPSTPDPAGAAAGPVVITGCSSGLGKASALAFRAAGYLTVATARRLEDLSDLAAAGCEVLRLDVTDESLRREAVAAVEARHGRVGILINNAGYGQYGPLEEVPLEDYRNAFETNVFGLARLSQLVLPGMRRWGRGRIVNISSVAGRATSLGGGVYHMTKHAVEALADALRPEVKPFGVHVINILPGPFVSRYRDKLVRTIPATGPDSPYAAFKRNLGDWMWRFLEPGAFGVQTSEQVARVVLKAATHPRPRPRYSVGFWARLGPLGRAITPDRVVDWFTLRSIPHR